MNKKGLAMKTIIGIVIALFLILMFIYVYGKTTSTAKESADCDSLGGTCVLPTQCDGVKVNGDCENKMHICCKGLS